MYKSEQFMILLQLSRRENPKQTNNKYFCDTSCCKNATRDKKENNNEK